MSGTIYVVKVGSSHAFKPLGFVEAGYDEGRVIAILKERHPWAVNGSFVFVPVSRESLPPDLELVV